MPSLQTPPNMERVGEIMREQRALFAIGFHEEMGRVEIDGRPQLGPVGYELVFGTGHGHGVLVTTDLELNVTTTRLLEPLS